MSPCFVVHTLGLYNLKAVALFWGSYTRPVQSESCRLVLGVHTLGLYNLKARVCNELNILSPCRFHSQRYYCYCFLLFSCSYTDTLNDVFRSHTVRRRMTGWWVNDESGRMRLDVVVVRFEALTQLSNRDAKENIHEGQEGLSTSGLRFELGFTRI